jgi:predicted ester cyclase
LVDELDPRRFYARYIEALNAHEFDRMNEFVSEHTSHHGEPGTRAAVVEDLEGIVDAVPDFHWEVTEILVHRDRLAVRLTNTGTPVKPWHGVAPSGRSFEIVEYALYRILNGRFVEMSNLHDIESLKQQLQG